MSIKFTGPFLASLAIAVIGCQQGATPSDVAEARKNVQEEQQDVAETKAEAQKDIAAEQSDADATRREAMKPVLDGDATGEQQDVAEAKTDANANVQEEQADLQQAKSELNKTEAALQQTQARDAFAKQAEQQLTAADQAIKDLKARQDNADDATQAQLQSQIDKLQEQRNRLANSLDEMSSAEIMKWQEHQRNVQTQLAELDLMLKEVK